MLSVAVDTNPAARKSRNTRATTSRTEPTGISEILLRHTCDEWAAWTLFSGRDIQQMPRHPLPDRPESIGGGLVQSFVQPSVQLLGQRPRHGSVTPTGGRQDPPVDPE